MGALMSLTTTERRQVKASTVVKDKTFIIGMMKTLTKLELKYQTPEHKRKKRLFTRRQKTSSIVPKEFTSICHALAAPEPEVVSVPEPFPHVRWNDIRFKPALPDPEPESHAQSNPVHQILCSMWTGIAPHFAATSTSLMWLVRMADHLAHCLATKPA